MLTIVLFVPLLATTVTAICPGFYFKLGIGNLINEGDGVKRWNIYDKHCRIVDNLTTTKNPCDQGIFGCSPAPIIFDEYTSSVTGLKYTCSRDPNSEFCGSDIISVCCHEDAF